MQMALKGMNKGRAPGIDKVCTEMIIAAGEVGVSWTKRMLNVCMSEASIPEDWMTVLIQPIWMGKDVKIHGSTGALCSFVMS